METYIAKIAEYGGADVEYTGFSGPQFANVMTIAKFLNAVGADSVSGDAIQSQVDSFTGPMMMTPAHGLRRGVADLPDAVRLRDGHRAVRRRGVDVHRRRPERQGDQPAEVLASS